MSSFILGMISLLGLAAIPILEVADPPGLHFLHQNSPTTEKYLMETMGGGVALLDYNNDGLLDVFFVNSGSLRAQMSVRETFARSEPRYWNRLFKQNKDHSFTDVTQTAGLSKAGDRNYGMGVTAADYDNDGFTDLYVTSYGKNILYHNNGNGTFSDVTAKAGVAAGGWSASAGFFDLDNDGNLDLFVTRYVDWDIAHNKHCGTTLRVYCLPGDYPAMTNVLYRNRGDGTFEDISQKSGIAAKPGRSLGVAFNDYDGNGFTDVFAANDGMEEFLFRNNGNGTFSEVAIEAGVSLSEDGKPYAGMGVDFRDYDNDGRPDILVTNLARQVYALYHNDTSGSFTYRSLDTGLGNLSAGSSGWGMRFEDFDNDGWKDLFISQSHVMDNVEQIDPSMHYLEPPMLALNHNGHFERSDAGHVRPVAGRGAAFGDLNNDGYSDVVMSVLGSRPLIFMNTASTKKHWLTLSLKGTESNRDGFGSRVAVNGQTQVVTSAGSYLSASDKRVHFGLGDRTGATVNVFWPSGVHQTLKDVRADQFLEVEEPKR